MPPAADWIARRWRDLAAIRQLENGVIPWQETGDGPSAREVRETSARNPLASAEGFLGYRVRTGAQSGGGRRETAAVQSSQILEWARRQGRLIDPAILALASNVGGVEHDVFHEEVTGRWIKITYPGRGGKQIVTRAETLGVPNTLATEDAPPFDYVRRLSLANSRLGDDFWLHGAVDAREGARLVVSQRHIDGEAAAWEEILLHFGYHGFRAINAKTFYHVRANLLVSDAHPGNVFKTPQDTVPFDVCVQTPTGALLNTVRPKPALNFDEDEQLALEL